MNFSALKPLAILIPLLPMAGWLILGIFGKYLPRKSTSYIGISMVAASFLLGLYCFYRLWGIDIPLNFSYGLFIAAGKLAIPFGLRLDSLSLLMILTVTGIATLINIYSTGCMAKNPDYSRFISWLNLSVFFMLLLVMADNLVLMLIGWEGVALCSYLLIGFKYEDTAAANAGKKAFLISRTGDVATLIGIILIATSPLALESNGIDRSLTFGFIFGKIDHLILHDPEYLLNLNPLITAIVLLLFIGAAGKSAQLFLYTWLPDSVKALAPASALMQTVTSVAAGVYLLARMHMLLLLSPTGMAIITVLSVILALYAASITIVQTNVKRALAWSTISQVAIMFLACGVGAFVAAMFHLVTHAIFKSCLILAAGSVRMGTNNESDLRKLGGLKKWMPATRMTFLLATASLAGFPLMAGFFSLNDIIHQSFTLPFAGGWNAIAGIIGLVIILLTTVYAYRLYYKIFEGEYRGPSDMEPKESPPSMVRVMWILAILSVIAGFFGFPIPGLANHGTTLSPVFDNNIQLAFQFRGANEIVSPPWILMAVSALLFVCGFLIVRHIYIVRPETQRELKIRYQRLYRALWEEFRLDEAFQAIFIRPGMWFSGVLWRLFDEEIIDRRLVEGTGKATGILGKTASAFQNGYIRTYALYMVLGIILLIWLANI